MMENTDKVLFEQNGAVAEIILNRPDKLNAIDRDCLGLLREHVARAEATPDARVILVRANGRAFCAGADLEFVSEIVQDRVLFPEFLAEWHETFAVLADSKLPSIAMVNGLALAGGFELVQACDFAVLSRDARIGDQHATFGLFPGGGSTQRLPRLIGVRRAKWLLFSGEWMSPEEAYQFGFVNEVVDASELESSAREMAAKLSARSPLATSAIKAAVRAGLEMPLDAALELERTAAAEHMRSEDVAIGLRAFRDRETPTFVGR
jgi:enoyl-CoA hydratase/carnithine racemase